MREPRWPPAAETIGPRSAEKLVDACFGCRVVRAGSGMSFGWVDRARSNAIGRLRRSGRQHRVLTWHTVLSRTGRGSFPSAKTTFNFPTATPKSHCFLASVRLVATTQLLEISFLGCLPVTFADLELGLVRGAWWLLWPLHTSRQQGHPMIAQWHEAGADERRPGCLWGERRGGLGTEAGKGSACLTVPVLAIRPVPTAASWRASEGGYFAVSELRYTPFSRTPATLGCLKVWLQRAITAVMRTEHVEVGGFQPGHGRGRLLPDGKTSFGDNSGDFFFS